MPEMSYIWVTTPSFRRCFHDGRRIMGIKIARIVLIVAAVIASGIFSLAAMDLALRRWIYR